MGSCYGPVLYSGGVCSGGRVWHLVYTRWVHTEGFELKVHVFYLGSSYKEASRIAFLPCYGLGLLRYPCLPHWKFASDLTTVLETGPAPDGDADALAGILLQVLQGSQSLHTLNRPLLLAII